MYDIFHKLMNRAARRLAIDSGWARRQFDAHVGQFRVLTYHGIVPDELADRPWVPSHYVTVSQFERQMAMLAELGPARSLSEVLTRTQVEDDVAPAVCITFDDGMADNVTLALPILRTYGHAATFFLTTGYIGTEQLLLNDVIRLLRTLDDPELTAHASELCGRVLTENGYGKTVSVFKYAPEVLTLWAQRMHEVDPHALECLRLMSWEQVRQLRSAGMEIGAHTVNHVILSREKRRTRRDEVLESVARVRSKLGHVEVPFAYPNGLAGDYDSFDADILAAIGVPYAVIEQPGWNDVTTPVLELHRNCIGLHCDDQAFLAQLYGVGEPALEQKSAGCSA